MQKNSHICRAEINRKTWNIELAVTPEMRTKGLMGREKLCETCGMLFVFSDSRPRTFWMKKTHIPLDIYFYNSQGQLVDGIQNMRPEQETSEPMQYTSQSAQYAIEVPAHSSLFAPEYFHPEMCFKR